MLLLINQTKGGIMKTTHELLELIIKLDNNMNAYDDDLEETFEELKKQWEVVKKKMEVLTKG